MVFAASALAAAWFAPAPAFAAGNEAAGNGAAAASAPFRSSREAGAYLARALPAATETNPKYRSPGSDALRRWRTLSAGFHDGEDGVIVSTREAFEDYRNGALSGGGTHEAAFAIDDVRVSDETADDLTESGEKAQGILFTCLRAPCISAVWDGEKSMADKTDIYIQDAAERAHILAAFQALRRKSEAP